MTSMTTIKVPSPLRDRIKVDAAHRGMSMADLLSHLLDRYERDERFAAVARAYRAEVDADYRHEIGVWDATSSDGLAE